LTQLSKPRKGLFFISSGSWPYPGHSRKKASELCPVPWPSHLPDYPPNGRVFNGMSVLAIELELFCNQRPQFVAARMTSGFEFRINQLAVHFDFKRPPATRDQCPGFDLWLKFLDQLCRDTHGFWRIVSSRAVFDRDFLFCHSFSPFLFVWLLVRLGLLNTSIPQFVALLKRHLPAVLYPCLRQFQST